MSRSKVLHLLRAKDSRRILAFGSEVERLRVTSVSGQGETRTLLTVQNHLDWSPVEQGNPPLLLGRTVETPTDDDLAAMQRQFRVFILDDEPTHFPSVRNLVSRAFYEAGVEDPGGVIRRAKAAWRLPMLRDIDCPVPGQELLDWWFNAELFHRDAEKKDKLDQLRASAGEAQLRVWLLLGFSYAGVVLIDFHIFLRDKTDLYSGASGA